MEINNRIREQVISDLQSINQESGINIAAFFNGLPSYIEVPEDNIYGEGGDIPAVSVSLSDGAFEPDDFDAIAWSALLTVRIYLVAKKDIDAELDAIGQKVLDVIDSHYTANGLLTLCNRSSYQYGRDEEQPWGTLDLTFNVEYEEISHE